MSSVGIEVWQIPILVTAAIVLVEAAVNAVLRRGISGLAYRRFRTAALGLLLALTVIVFVAALGPTLADELSSVAAAMAAVVALWLTYRSYQSSAEAEPRATGAPDPTPPPTPAAPPPPVPVQRAQPAPTSSDAGPVTVPGARPKRRGRGRTRWFDR
ncbi:hypothetical protein ACWKSP_07095 [Micromonosporaceae bacterium Da 78-11]